MPSSNSKKRRATTLVGMMAGTVVVLGVSLVGGQALADTLGNDDEGITRESVAASLPPIATNEKGQTYGSQLQTTKSGESPQLVLVIGDSGREGYVYASELEGPTPSSPEEAFRQSGEFSLDVYLSDGVTVIDRFTVGGAAPKS